MKMKIAAMFSIKGNINTVIHEFASKPWKAIVITR
ncbi:hypothetical protein POPTR_005G122150v4 [Populus trichocarpa]|uniref:Uncharacterized protein n=1 Tax=Populus trichocarpa TaxID=3694 RepID=A0ACC0SZJ9_POPTR|nr:hypothetical protein POPTR_005G122150v4 [Populus trichocarpa]